MKQNIFITFFLLCLFYAPCAYAQTAFTFTQALERAYTVDEGYAASRQSLYAAQKEKSAAFGLHLPKIGLSAKYTNIVDPMTLDLSPIRDAIQPLYTNNSNPALQGIVLPPFEHQLQKDDFFNFAATASLPLFTGGKISAANAVAKSNIEMARAQLSGTKAGLVTETAKKYYGVLLLKEVYRAREEVFSSMSQHYQDTKKMEKSGVVSKMQTLQSEVALAEAKRNRDKAKNDYELALNALKTLLSIKDDITLTGKLFIPKKEAQGLDYYLKQAAANNPYITQMQIARDLNKHNEKVKTSAFYPNLYAFARQEIYKHDLTLLDPETAFGVGIEYSFFDGFSDYNKTKAAKASTKKAELLKNKTVKSVNLLVEQEYKKLSNAKTQYLAAQSAIKFNREYVRTQKIAFKAGMASTTDVLDAEMFLFRAKVDVANAEYEFLISLASLLEAAGISDKINDYIEGE